MRRSEIGYRGRRRTRTGEGGGTGVRGGIVDEDREGVAEEDYTRGPEWGTAVRLEAGWAGLVLSGPVLVLAYSSLVRLLLRTYFF